MNDSELINRVAAALMKGEMCERVGLFITLADVYILHFYSFFIAENWITNFVRIGQIFKFLTLKHMYDFRHFGLFDSKYCVLLFIIIKFFFSFLFILYS